MELTSSVTQQRVTHTQLLSHITHSHHHRDGWGNTKKKTLAAGGFWVFEGLVAVGGTFFV